MAKVLMIVAQKGFRDEELFVPKKILEDAGHNVKVGSLTRNRAEGSKGGSVIPDMALFEANPGFFDCICVVGGPGAKELSQNDQVLDFVKAGAAAGKLMAAICIGPLTLANAGILDGREATVYPDRNAIVELRNSGARYLTQKCVVSDNVITADGPESAGEFGKSIVQKLKKK